MTVNDKIFTFLVGEPIEILSETQIHLPTQQGIVFLDAIEFGYRTAQELITAIEANPEINLVSKN
jgi:hypothetical protein